MGEPILPVGKQSGICVYDGADWRKAKGDADGHVQVDTVTTANPSNLDIAISALRDAICAAAPTGNDLADIYSILSSILTELQAKLETADLNLDAQKDLQVDVKTMPTVTTVPGSGEKLFGFSGRVGFAKSGLDVGAGTNTLQTDPVPSGVVHVITAFKAVNTTSAITEIFVGPVYDGVMYPVVGIGNPAALESLNWSGTLVLMPGDLLRAVFCDCIAGDDLYFEGAGYKLAVP